MKLRNLAQNSFFATGFWYGLQAVGIYLWVSNLKTTNAYFSVYVLCALLGFYCLIQNRKDGNFMTSGALRSAVFLSVLFSLLVTVANYPIFQQIRNPDEVSAGANRMMNLLECAAVFLGGIPVCYHCLNRLYYVAVEKNYRFKNPVSGSQPVKFFLACFGVILVIDMVYLFLVDFPGNVSHDSLRQITQTYTGNYDNLLPYWSTRMIGVILKLGYAIFGTSNGAVAFYSFLQLTAMAAIFSYVMVTLYEKKVSRLALAAAFGVYAFIPYNIAFSTSMWKDVLFTGGVVLMITAQYRVLQQLGKQKCNQLCIVLGGILVCIMRTNGWYVMAIAAVILLICGKKIRRAVGLTMAAVALVGFLLNVPMLKVLGAAGIDKIETMSLPMQQIARVVVKDREISREDWELLDQVVDMDQVPELYQEWTSDPIKYNASLKNPQYLHEHLGEYLSLWVRLGLEYPKDYLEAWVELTKGYWNGGYNYYIYAEYVADNDFGIEMDRSGNPVKSLVKAYFGLSKESILFEPLLSIGLHVWLAVGMFWLCLVRKRRESVLFIPLLVILAGLWVGTPVFSEFRYAYPVVAAMPLLVPVSLMGDR